MRGLGILRPAENMIERLSRSVDGVELDKEVFSVR